MSTADASGDNVSLRRRPPHLYSIPPGERFLPTLVEAILSGELIPGFAPRGDPLALSTATIYVPTRRAVRALRAQFVSALKMDAALLPDIRALGDDDDEALVLSGIAQGDAQTGTLQFEPVMNSLQRQLLLTSLIRKWTQMLEKTSRDLFDEEINLPSTTSDAAWLANDLARLMEQMETEEIEWSSLKNLVPDDHAEWWKLTLTFLNIATEQWPRILKERGVTSAARRRSQMLRDKAQRLLQRNREQGTTGPVIAAGSTGSIPATAELLAAIAQLSNGAVVLPGLDRHMNDKTWAMFATGLEDYLEASIPGHAQFGMVNLLRRLQAGHEQIHHLESTYNPALIAREAFVSQALLPASATDQWVDFKKKFSVQEQQAAFDAVTVVKAPNERLEAMSIALVLRETLETEDQTAALITPDRTLARRVMNELKRFGIEINDSAGQPLAETPQGTLLHLLLAVAFAPPDPVALVGLLKHPMALFGFDANSARARARQFELALLRGALVAPVPGNIHTQMKVLRQRIDNADMNIRLSLPRKRLSENDWQNAEEFAKRLDDILAPLVAFNNLEQGSEVSITALIETTIHALNRISESAETTHDRQAGSALYSSDSGEAFANFLNDLIRETASAFTDASFTLPPEEWPGTIRALMSGRVVRSRSSVHPRLNIWGPLEARLQSVDRVVLGALNEGSWPQSTRNDPFLSRSMKSEITLEPPERRIGLAAHDFYMALGAEEVFLTRSERADNAPTVASRWLQRLTTLIDKDTELGMVDRGHVWIAQAEMLDATSESAKAIERPEPKPPLAARPKGASITEIERWIRDPYAIYAKRILKLDALEPLLRDADARERGTLYHKALERFVSEFDGDLKQDGLAALQNIGNELFKSASLPLEIEALWRPRFDEIAHLFIDWEIERADDIKTSHVEHRAALDAIDGFRITGYADRIDYRTDGSVDIVDYKTGTSPSASQVRNFFAPQLPLTAALLLRGGFPDLTADEVNVMLYPRLRVGPKLIVTDVCLEKSKKVVEAGKLADDTWLRLVDLISAYQNPDKGYLSRARPFKENEPASDYDHLARVREWSVGGDDDDEEFEE